jgi:hypothetical protein
MRMSNPFASIQIERTEAPASMREDALRQLARGAEAMGFRLGAVGGLVEPADALYSG